MNGVALRDLMVSVRGARPTRICVRCGALRNDVDPPCGRHPDRPAVSLHSADWRRIVGAPPRSGLRTRLEQLRRFAAVLSLGGVVGALWMVRLSFHYQTYDPISFHSLLVSVPVAALLVTYAWVVPWARANGRVVRPNRAVLRKLAWIGLGILLVSAAFIVPDLILLRRYHLRSYLTMGPEWWTYGFAVPFFVASAVLGWRKADLRGVRPPERDAGVAPELGTPRVGTLVAETGPVLGYHLRTHPLDRVTPTDGYVRELDIELDEDGGRVHVGGGPLLLLRPEGGARNLGDEAVHHSLVWWWNDHTSDPSFHVSGAELNLLRVGDRVVVHSRLEGDLEAGDGYRESGAVSYLVHGPLLLERVVDD